MKKKIIYNENIILQSLYKSAVDKRIPAIIIELREFMDFRLIFKEILKDRFQIMYEVFINEKNKVIETGNILFANLILTGEEKSLYYFDKEVMVITIKTEKVFKKL